ncbi:MAG: hypothetical protein AVDCRST_MAG73-1594 [uncultured Thermomicrobiales bacterium]|uniref:Uncharacterized protein n=1 Tax=uncultured Thermomicrobiales bacterium TaxID=1645740 RepID=A0A6J4U3N1_9BACT|nr:MAG: hypothetical protein AVDCRST_MAG73-1594 [uncultured Thermomicrobiales bacterium]
MVVDPDTGERDVSGVVEDDPGSNRRRRRIVSAGRIPNSSTRASRRVSCGAGAAGAGDREAAARAGGVEHDPSARTVGRDALEPESAVRRHTCRADRGIGHVQCRAGAAVDRVGGPTDDDRPAPGGAEPGAARRVDVEVAAAEGDRAAGVVAQRHRRVGARVERLGRVGEVDRAAVAVLDPDARAGRGERAGLEGDGAGVVVVDVDREPAVVADAAAVGHVGVAAGDVERRPGRGRAGRVGDGRPRAEREGAARAVQDVDAGVATVERGRAAEGVRAVGVVELEAGAVGGAQRAAEGQGAGGVAAADADQGRVVGLGDAAAVARRHGAAGDRERGGRAGAGDGPARDRQRAGDVGQRDRLAGDGGEGAGAAEGDAGDVEGLAAGADDRVVGLVEGDGAAAAGQDPRAAARVEVQPAVREADRRPRVAGERDGGVGPGVDGLDGVGKGDRRRAAGVVLDQDAGAAAGERAAERDRAAGPVLDQDRPPGAIADRGVDRHRGGAAADRDAGRRRVLDGAASDLDGGPDVGQADANGGAVDRDAVEAQGPGDVVEGEPGPGGGGDGDLLDLDAGQPAGAGQAGVGPGADRQPPHGGVARQRHRVLDRDRAGPDRRAGDRPGREGTEPHQGVEVGRAGCPLADQPLAGVEGAALGVGAGEEEDPVTGVGADRRRRRAQGLERPGQRAGAAGRRVVVHEPDDGPGHGHGDRRVVRAGRGGGGVVADAVGEGDVAGGAAGRVEREGAGRVVDPGDRPARRRGGADAAGLDGEDAPGVRVWVAPPRQQVRRTVGNGDLEVGEGVVGLGASQGRRVVDGSDRDIPRGDVAQVVGRGAVVDLEGNRPRRRARVLAGIRVRHRAQGRLVVGGRVGAGEGQHAGGGVPAAGDGRRVGEGQHVLAVLVAGGDGHRRAAQVGGIVGDGDRGADGGGRVVLGVVERGRLDAGQDRRVVDGDHGDVPRGDVAGRGRVVGDLELDRPRRRARVLAGVGVGHRAQGRLVVGAGVGAGEGQHAGGGVPAAGDGRGIGKAKDVLVGGEAGRDRDRGPGRFGAVDVPNRERGGDRRGRVVLGEGERGRLDAGQLRRVVDGGHVDGDRRGVRDATVVGREGERGVGRPEPVRRRDEEDVAGRERVGQVLVADGGARGVRALVQRAVGWQGRDREGERVPFGVRGGQRDGDAGVLGGRDRLVVRHRRRVRDPRDRHRHRRRRRPAVAVADRVGEGVGAGLAVLEGVELPVRVVRDAGPAVGDRDQARRPGRVDARHRQGVRGVGIRVVGQDGDRRRAALRRRRRIGDGGGTVVRAGDGDGHGRRVGAAVAVVGGVGEAVGPLLAGGERLERAGRVVGDGGPVVRDGAGRPGRVHGGDGQGVAVRVVVVGQDGDRDRRAVLGRADRVGRRDRVVVGAGDRDRHRRAGGGALGVRDLVAEGVGGGRPRREAVEQGAGVVGEDPVAVVRHRRAAGAGRGVVADREQRLLERVRVGVVGQDAARRERVVLVRRGVGIGVGRRRVVGAGERDRHRRRVLPAEPVVDGVGKGIGGGRARGQGLQIRGGGRVVREDPVPEVRHRGAERARPVGGTHPVQRHDRERVALRVRVVGEDAARRDGGVLVGRERVVDGVGRQVAGRDPVGGLLGGAGGQHQAQGAVVLAIAQVERRQRRGLDGDLVPLAPAGEAQLALPGQGAEGERRGPAVEVDLDLLLAVAPAGAGDDPELAVALERAGVDLAGGGRRRRGERGAGGERQGRQHRDEQRARDEPTDRGLDDGHGTHPSPRIRAGGSSADPGRTIPTADGVLTTTILRVYAPRLRPNRGRRWGKTPGVPPPFGLFRRGARRRPPSMAPLDGPEKGQGCPSGLPNSRGWGVGRCLRSLAPARAGRADRRAMGAAGAATVATAERACQ